MSVPTYLQPYLDTLRKAFPDGVSDEDYRSLLAALFNEFSEENLGIVVAELVDGERVVVANDSIKAGWENPPPEHEVERIRQRLLAVGWDFDEEQ